MLVMSGLFIFQFGQSQDVPFTVGPHLFANAAPPIHSFGIAHTSASLQTFDRKIDCRVPKRVAVSHRQSTMMCHEALGVGGLVGWQLASCEWVTDRRQRKSQYRFSDFISSPITAVHRRQEYEISQRGTRSRTRPRSPVTWRRAVGTIGHRPTSSQWQRTNLSFSTDLPLVFYRTVCSCGLSKGRSAEVSTICYKCLSTWRITPTTVLGYWPLFITILQDTQLDRVPTRNLVRNIA